MPTTRSELARAARQIMNRLGFGATLEKPGTQVYDVASATNTISPQTYSVQVAVSEYSASDVDGQNILRGDKKVYISPASGVVPEEGDSVSGLPHGRVRIERVWSVLPNADGTSQIYVCQTRG